MADKKERYGSQYSMSTSYVEFIDNLESIRVNSNALELSFGFGVNF